MLFLDSDTAILRNLDHLLETMLARPSIGELKTPQGCLNQGGALSNPNTGVWGVRPSSTVYSTLLSWMHGSVIDCHVGMQDVHVQFFSHLSPRARSKFGAFEQVPLHVGYNMKGGDWARCFKYLNFSADDVYVTHWSGKRKPRRGLHPEHPMQQRALSMYLGSYCSWARSHNSSDSTCDEPIPLGHHEASGRLGSQPQVLARGETW